MWKAFKGGGAPAGSLVRLTVLAFLVTLTLKSACLVSTQSTEYDSTTYSYYEDSSSSSPASDQVSNDTYTGVTDVDDNSTDTQTWSDSSTATDTASTTTGASDTSTDEAVSTSSVAETTSPDTLSTNAGATTTTADGATTTILASASDTTTTAAAGATTTIIASASDTTTTAAAGATTTTAAAGATTTTAAAGATTTTSAAGATTTTAAAGATTTTIASASDTTTTAAAGETATTAAAGATTTTTAGATTTTIASASDTTTTTAAGATTTTAAVGATTTTATGATAAGATTTTNAGATTTAGASATTAADTTATTATGATATTATGATATTAPGATATTTATGATATTTAGATATTGTTTTTATGATATTTAGATATTTAGATATTTAASGNTITTTAATITTTSGNFTSITGTTTITTAAASTNTTTTAATTTVSSTRTTAAATTTTLRTTTATACGGSLSGSGGEIKSPNYPGTYPNNIECVWTLTANAGEVIRITFTDFDLQDSSWCGYDYVEVRDGQYSWSNLLDRMCGSAIPLALTSTSSQMRVTFKSDSSVAYTGFRATWTSVCESTFRPWSTTIQTPNYPNSNPSSKECSYIIEVWSFYVVQLTFSSFSLGVTNGNCSTNYVEVRDGAVKQAPLLGRYCSNSLPPKLESSSNYMWITFVTNGATSNKGFSASYVWTTPSCKPQTLTDKTGTIKSLLYPNNYPNLADCTWTIQGGIGDIIELIFTAFLLEGPAYWCYWDRVKVYDGARLVGIYCGATIPQTITTTSNTVTVTFQSDYSVTYSGFSASYRIYNPYSDAAKKQYDLYPYGVANGDEALPKTQDSTAQVFIKTGFQVRDTLQYFLYIGYNGLVTFGNRDKGKKLEMDWKKMQILPFNSDINARDSDSAVYYHVYTNNRKILSKASTEAREFTRYKDYNATWVIVITWSSVSHKSSKNPKSEQATFQLALMTNGRRSFATITWQQKAMNWINMRPEALVIGFSNGWQSEAILSEYSNNHVGFVKMDKVIGNTGRYGMQIYEVGNRYSPDHVCQDWYDRNLPYDEQRQAGFELLPQCPCSWWFLWGNWVWSRYLDNGWSGICYRMNLGNSRSVYPYGKECCYSWNWWWWWWWWYPIGQYISSGPNAGAAMAYNPAYWSLQGDYQVEDKDAHDVCCYDTTSSEYCDMYYSLRPVGECTTRIPFRFSFTWGDPHIKTLDGGEYTMNGWCEYNMILIRTPNTTHTLQGRTGLAETENGTLTNATVFTAFGAEENGVRVFVELQNGTNSLIIYGNETDYTNLFKDKVNDTVIETEPFTLKNDNNKLVVTFSSGVGLTISVGIKSLDISVSMPEEFATKTSGLLGNFNGNKTDDFRFPNGTLVGTNLTDRQIYKNFAPYWTVTSQTTVMRYPPRKGSSDYCHPEFEPIYLDEQPPSVLQAAKALCGEAVACIYDYVATGSRAVASASNSTASDASNLEKTSKNTIPQLNFNGNLTVVEGVSYTFNLHGSDNDTGDVLTYFAVSDGNGTVVLNNSTGDVTITANSSIAVNLAFYVSDSLDVNSPQYEFPVIVCNSTCSSHGTCDFTRVTVSTASRNFLYAACNCFPAYSGDDCKGDFDGCSEHPCSAQQVCEDIPAAQQGNSSVGFRCGNCSSGYYKDPSDQTRCNDIDECNSTAIVCPGNGTCVNTPGSFHCDCDVGFRLKADGRTCEDINECAEHTVSCQQECVNTNGSSYCQCYAGYNMTSKGTCEPDASLNSTCTAAGCSQGCTVTLNASNVRVASCICNAGYRAFNATACVDRDECSEGVCSQSCINTDGSFACTCYTGYVLGIDERTCTPCPSMQYGEACSRTCQCNGRGLSCDPVRGCVCRSGWRGTGCEEDINECVETPDVCGRGQVCVNNDGSYSCACPSGYTKNAANVCEDIDECATGSLLNTCGQKEDCKNAPGTFSCVCKAGYHRENGNCADINECSSGSVCQQVCVNVDGSYNCECLYGFTANADRTSCYQSEDVCAHADQLHCSQGCTLDDKDLAYCFCDSGYKLASDLQTCIDIDECAEGKSGCSHTCVNLVASFGCSCPVGMMLDNDKKTCIACPAGKYGENCARTCTCGIGASGCNATTGCVCQAGWTGVNCDQDINECETPSVQTTCRQSQAQCLNFMGGYRCQCDTGYQADSNNICRDVDECAGSPSPCGQLCENSPGSYRCLCNTGFVYNDTSKQCEDVNECALTATNDCTQRCDNTVGSYRCGCDIPGLVLSNDGVSCEAQENCTRTDCPSENGGCSLEQCFCNAGYNLSSTDNHTCNFIHVDWCSVAQPCQQTCNNTADGKTFYCNCSEGYLLNKDGTTCRECPDNTYGQGCNETCTCNKQNTQACNKVNGTCTCKQGWTGSTCDQDIDECATGAATCPGNSTCVNLPGSSICSCNPGFLKSNSTCVECDDGFYGDSCGSICGCSVHSVACSKTTGACTCADGWNGTFCESDINECTTVANNCTGSHVICVNTDGSFRCDCSSGYAYNSTSSTCFDIDECFSNVDTCLQECTNTDGGYTCSCATDYRGTGNDCTELKKIDTRLEVNFDVPASDLQNKNGAKYAQWKRLAAEALFAKLNRTVPGLREVIITNLEVGSLIIYSQMVVDDVTYPAAVSNLLTALVSLASGSITIGNSTGTLTITINGTLVSTDALCTLYNIISPCPSGQECTVENGQAVCKSPANDNIPLIVGLCVGLGVPFIIAVVVVIVVVCKKKSGKVRFRRGSSVSPEKSEEYSKLRSETTTPVLGGAPAKSTALPTKTTGDTPSGRITPSRQGSWTNDI